MRVLREIYEELYNEGVYFHTGDYGLDGDCDSVIVSDGVHFGIFLDIQKCRTPIMEKMAVSHEWSHYRTGTLYSLDADETVIRKAEYRADKQQILRLVPKEEVDKAAQEGCRNVWEFAEHFNVPEDFMRRALSFYRDGIIPA